MPATLSPKKAEYPPPEKNRALSIRQPHAEDIMLGIKKHEYRSFPTKIRGRVFVYASLTPDSTDAEAMPRGVIIGTVDITGCEGVEGDYAWSLERPQRLEKPLKPAKRAQPSFFFAF